jgi:predicted dehydrogenase
MKAVVIGVGRMGRRHAHAIRKTGWSLVGVYDISPDSLQLAAQEHKLESGALFGDLEALFAECRPDVVVIATNADTHCAMTCLAAARGAKFILVEKPMAVSVAECDRMIEACQKAGAQLAVNHQMRFMPAYTVPRSLFHDPAFGGLCSMTVVGGNFGFAMNGSHYFEAFRFLTGEVPVEVSSWFSPEIVPNPRGPQYQDRAGCIRAVTASGKRLYMDVSADQGHGFGATYACRNGVIAVDELAGELVSSEREAQYRELPTTRYGMPCISKRDSVSPPDLIETTVAVLNALVTGQNSVTGEDGRQVVELLVAAHQSAEQGGAPVRLDGNGVDRQRIFPWA